LRLRSQDGFTRAQPPGAAERHAARGEVSVNTPYVRGASPSPDPSTAEIRGRARPPHRRVLCATDLSPTGDSAVRLAYRLIGDGGTLFLVHVYDPTWVLRDSARPTSLPPSMNEVLEATRDCAREHLAALPFRGQRPDVTTEEIMVNAPNAATAIVDQIRATGAEVAVLGTHGRTGLGRLLMGSVATDVLKRSPVPVVLFHDPLVKDA
jgi:nucleotide-binding universal stress UspA family protein